MSKAFIFVYTLRQPYQIKFSRVAFLYVVGHYDIYQNKHVLSEIHLFYFLLHL